MAKALARAGIASRRKAEELIVSGQVRVNGRIVSSPGTTVDVDTDVVEVGKHRVSFGTPRIYLMLNKPAGVVSTRIDPQHRRTVLDLLPQNLRHLYPVGRLDVDTEGLLLLSNDGAFTHRITHPRHEVTKTYRVHLNGRIPRSELRRIEHGIWLDDGMTAPCKARLLRTMANESIVEVVIHEGRKRLVRRMFKVLGFPVLNLKRMRIGDLSLGNLAPGQFRELTREEVERLSK